MMGQKEPVASNALRRMILMFLVAALMAAMMAVSAMPAVAKNSFQDGLDSPPGPPNLSGGPTKNDSSIVGHFANGACVAHFGKNGGKRTGGGC